jgi:dienelactone hydrolase
LSTGVYVSDWIKRLEDHTSPQIADAEIGPKLMEQTEDVQSAVDWVKTEPAAADHKVAIFGHSYGGMVSLFSAIKVTGIRAAIDSAGGALSWNNHPYLRQYLKDHTPHVNVPTFMMQDDRECAGEDPTKTLGPLLPNNGSSFKLYHWAPRNCVDAHHQFIHGPGEAMWGQDVLHFLAQHGVAP